MIEGPLALSKRPGGLRLRIENSDLQGSDPPTAARLKTWTDQHICVAGRPEWVFVKVHTHGCPEQNMPGLLGGEARTFHRSLSENYNDGVNWQLHYVTAREMYNVAIAAMAGESGSPAEYFDYELSPPPVALS